ncbi:translation initiation factor 2B, epsilon subunit [Aspergillus steynii IBT 23096]|uniref:Mannose-1-phosphate guanyltransferase n=1 Tax=Aspergillus steynii IBT 23096 TaxID=1392250 RepID=A0A2I2GBF9_9EURO|nr:translation initiation factor 2B, epsilon subunit [Aspergillus steynii IBT 23096]PLB50219.1 translation initiation factor 2B, epsilon subunit [Aspergillus steynii IBT 23096]
MGPKKGGNSSKQRGNAAEEVEETLQAVVLADTFETRFEPFTLDTPRCLLPLANTPLIEYTLEFLANAGVEDVFLYGGAHSDQLEKYINASKWRSLSSPFKQLNFLKSTSTSVGDVMRDLDGKHLITGDFIVVSGDVISNMPIEGALAKHRARREKDKNAIMTMILREAGRNHRTKSTSVSPVFVVDPTKDRCLHYEEIDHHSSESSRLNIDSEIILTHRELDIRQDLIDCNIDICTPDVLSLWSDSFDYQTPRKQFLFGVLKDYELNGKTIHTHIIKDHYAARVRNLKAYDAVSRDVISRWAYPLCPDTNLLAGHTYDLRKGYLYQEQGVTLARSCVIGRRTVIGQGTSIGDKSTVKNTVLGRNCKIGKNVTLDGAYIWDGAVIGDGTTIRQAVLADNVAVGKDCMIESGVLLSYGVKIADGTTVSEGKRITKAPREEDGVVPASDPAVVGKDGEGYEYVPYEDEDDSDDESNASSGLVYNMANLSLSTESISTLSSEISDYAGSRTGYSDSEDEDENGENFVHDAAVSVYDSLREGITSDVVQLELVSLRMTANASDNHVRRAVSSAFMRRIPELIAGGKSASDAIADVFGKYQEIVERALFDRDSDKKPDQVDLLLLLQQELASRPPKDSFFVVLCSDLYQMELLEEETFEQWWADERSSSSNEMKVIKEQATKFIQWLATADEEEDSDEESEEESDDE